MLRIVVTENTSEQRWTLQGRLTGSTMDELIANWRANRRCPPTKNCIVDLNRRSLLLDRSLQPVGLTTGAPLALNKIQAIIDQAANTYNQSNAKSDVANAIQTVLGWDTIYEPENHRVLSPVSRVWSVGWGGYVLFDWDTFFAATMASIGDRDLAYANAIEIKCSETQQGFVPNYARLPETGKDSDRSEPPVGAITVQGLYQQFARPLVLRKKPSNPCWSWNRWWAAQPRHRRLSLPWGSDGDNAPPNLDDSAKGNPCRSHPRIRPRQQPHV